MADPQTVLPYHDPFEAQYSEDIFCILDNRNPTLEELSIQEPFPDPTSIPQQGTGIGSSNDPFENRGVWHVKNDPNTGNSQTGPSEIHVESSHGNQTNFHAGSSYFEDSILLSEWPPTPIPFGCSCCQVLREIIHTNGNEVTTLEIHGRVGMISHAVLEVQLNMETLSPSYHHQMFDFCKKSLEEVKQFLVQYCLERRQAGFFVISDPFSVFYEALCVGFVWTENQYCDEFNPPPSSNLEELQGSNKAENDNNEQPRVPKTNLSEQRQRTGKITLKEIGNYFHLPIEEAAKKMRLCPTVVKKICRRDGLARWPHRKIKSMERQISYWAGLLSSNDPQESARAQNEILRLQQEIENIRQGAVGSR